jgi:hypothetical protein
MRSTVLNVYFFVLNFKERSQNLLSAFENEYLIHKLPRKRPLDKMRYYGGLGKRGSYLHHQEPTESDESSQLESSDESPVLVKKALDKMKYYGGLGKRMNKLDKLRYMGNLGK